MWLDSVVLFPLVALGVERLAEGKGWRTYVFSLTLTIFCNFYLAFLICATVVLYFVVRMALREGPFDRKETIGAVFRFGFFSLLSGMLVMFLLLPTAMALSQTAVSDSSFPGFAVYRNLFQLLSVHLAGARPVVLGQNEDLPNFYSGVLTVLMLPLFFSSRRIARKEKLGLGLILVFFWACSCLRQLDYVIHGCHFPANLPHRFTFMYSFFLLQAAYVFWQKRERVSWLRWAAALGILAGCTLIPEFLIVPRIYELDRVYSNQDLLFNVLIIGCYVVLYQARTAPKEGRGLWRRIPSRVVLGLCLAAVLGECLVSGLSGMYRTTEGNALVKYMDSSRDAKAFLDERESDGFYRMEFRRFTTINDGALYHYPGVSQFSSLAPGGISHMMTNLGIAGAGNSYRYYDPTPLIDSMLGVKYVLNKDDAGEATSLGEHYTFIKQIGNLWLYENPQSLPVGFLVSDAVEDWKPEENQPFQTQNQWAGLASGVDEPVFLPLKWSEVSSEHLQITGTEDGSIHYQVENPRDLEKIPSITVRFVSDRRQYLYLYVNEGNAKRLVYTTGQERQDREVAAGNGLIDVGWVDKGEAIDVYLALTNRGEFEKSYRKEGTTVLKAAGFEQETWNQVYGQLEKGPWTIERWGDTFLEGSVTAGEGQLLFTSIPYIKGWEAWVDGERTELLSLGNGGVIGIPMEPGDHQVRLEFHVPGLKAGLIVSAAAWLLLLLLLWYDRKLFLATSAGHTGRNL